MANNDYSTSKFQDALTEALYGYSLDYGAPELVSDPYCTGDWVDRQTFTEDTAVTLDDGTPYTIPAGHYVLNGTGNGFVYSRSYARAESADKMYSELAELIEGVEE